jgi:aspartate/methionine/tyrosine aminotransferase
MDTYETTPNVLNVAETCCASLSIDDLQELSEDKHIPPPPITSQKLTYGPIRGSNAIRERLSALYSARVTSPLPSDNILLTPGAIAANFLSLYTLVGPGDHVICVYPTYQQLYAVPESLGAEVSLWKLKKENKYVPDMEDLKELVRPNTKMIIINNPNNPTGSTIPKSVLQSLVEYAKSKDIIVLSDEVYRPLFHGISPMDAEYPPSIISLGYSKTIVTGSMSKAYSLAGIRVGWIASRDKSILEAIASARDYTTISVSQIDDQIASYALSASVLHALLGRNIKLAKTNLGLVTAFVDEHRSVCSWVKPTGGTTAFIKFEKDGQPIDDVAFTRDLLEKTKVMILPGSKCFGHGEDFHGFVRLGYVCETEVLKEALAKLGEYIRANL